MANREQAGNGAGRVIFIIGLAAVALFFGWSAFRFLCDDAYIAFRYVANSQLGYGYVWNPSPFLPVEGYTCFLWILLLDFVWTVTGIAPPSSSTWLGLGFGVGSLVVTAWMVCSIPLCAKLSGCRDLFLSIVLLGLVTNATFLTWTSSGLETSLFNFLLLAWVASCFITRPNSQISFLAMSLSSSLLALTRPDGLLFAATSSAIIMTETLFTPTRRPVAALRFVLPLVLPGVHLLWRHHFYGEWLPNTFYAKQVAAWPQSGVRYLASFVLEYGLWFWGGLVLWCLVAVVRAGHFEFRAPLRTPGRMTRVLVVIAIFTHLAYYTLIIGGDHFEYRVYSYLPALVLVATVWLTNRCVSIGSMGAKSSLLISLLVVLLSWPIPWTYWTKARRLNTRNETFNLVIPMADAFPPGIGWYGELFDSMQTWLIVGHAVGKRHREHQIFHQTQLVEYALPRVVGEIEPADYPILPIGSVGVPGWILRHVNIIDVWGLNDYVVARNPVREERYRRMAHDRRPPAGYVECFRPNVKLIDGKVVIRRRVQPLTDEDIRSCEAQFRDQINGTSAFEFGR